MSALNPLPPEAAYFGWIGLALVVIGLGIVAFAAWRLFRKAKMFHDDSDRSNKKFNDENMNGYNPPKEEDE